MNPIGDRLLIKPIDAAEVTSGGVIMPDLAQEATNQGKVIAVGPGKLLENGQRGHMQTKVGDIVGYAKFGTNKITIDEVDYVTIKEQDTLIIIQKEDK
tara:strand:- start:22 stop:315 length:294 start_codon:yes stop_codon:yes gene_type:complete